MNKKQEIKNRIDLINKGEVPEGYKKCFGYIVPNDWDIVPIKKVVTQVHRSVDKPNEPYYRLSVRSHAKGTFHSFVEDPETVAMDELFEVKENDLVINITFAWEHAIAIVKKEDDGLLVSHRFPTYEFNNNVCVKFYENIIKFPRIKKMLGDMSPGGAGRNRVLNQTDFYNKLYVPYTSRKEQEKIAEILSCCDKVIELKEKIIEEKIKEKKHIRFNLLSLSKLKYRPEKLGDITTIQTGNSNTQDKIDTGEYPFYVRSKIIERSNKYTYDGEAILIPGDGEIGKIFHYINGKFDYHQRVYKISNFQIALGKYVYYYLSEFFEKHALKYTAKATVDSLRLPMLTNFVINIPEQSVQQKIINIMDSIENQIQIFEQELEQYKQLKKSLSQLLLTGIVRVNEV